MSNNTNNNENSGVVGDDLTDPFLGSVALERIHRAYATPVVGLYYPSNQEGDIIRRCRFELLEVARRLAEAKKEAKRLSDDLDGLGQRIIGEIIDQGMTTISYPDPEATHVIVWTGNADEQLECVVADFLREKEGGAS